jgi:hypothetical protein
MLYYLTVSVLKPRCSYYKDGALLLGLLKVAGADGQYTTQAFSLF